ncbi:MAG: hypothetical protein ACE37H_16060 [Phycisphaeraceae bacterium]
MNRIARACCALALVVVSAGIASCQHAGPTQAETPRPSYDVPVVRVELKHSADTEAANRHAEAALQRKISLDADNLALEQAINFARDTTGANIAVNWPALELVGIDQDSLVSLNLTNVTAMQMLDLVLEQVGADAFDRDKPSCLVHEGVLLISTIADLQTYTETRIYDVSWLLDEYDKLIALLYQDHRHAESFSAIFKQSGWMPMRQPGFDLNAALSGTNSGSTPKADDGGGGRGGLFGDHDTADDQGESFYVLSREERIDVVMDLIHSTVGEYDDWLDDVYSMRELNQTLVVKTTRPNHTQIEAILVALRKAQVAHFERKARLIEVFTLLKDAEAYRLEQRYSPAMRKIDQALRVDPGNAEAQALRAIVIEAGSR